MRISDWSSDVCSSDLLPLRKRRRSYDDGGSRLPGGASGPARGADAPHPNPGELVNRSTARMPLVIGAPVPVADRLGRSLRDLRVSVIETCNYRSPYCMPADRTLELNEHDHEIGRASCRERVCQSV